jgi:hypothetical protein
MSTNSRDIAIGISVPFAVLIILGLVTVAVLVTLKAKELQHGTGGECHKVFLTVKCMLE